MRFDVLGPLRATTVEDTIPLGEPQQQKLLALLLTSPNRVLSTERLIDEIWGDELPSSARHLVHVYVSRLRAVLGGLDGGPRLVREGSGYAIRVTPDEVDALEFEALIEEGRDLLGRDQTAARNRLCTAVGLWRGTPYGDLGDESALLKAEAVRLEELYVAAVGDRIELDLNLGHHAELVGELEGLTTQHPYHERFRVQLMRALYRCGRQAEALRAYQQLRRILGEELGIEPGREVRELEGRILLQDPDLLWEAPPPPSNLPTWLSSFVGRREEVAEVAELLGTSRLVTLCGTGGVGKTRLAVKVADMMLPRFRDGVWWIDVAALSDPDQFVPAVAVALGVTLQPDTPLVESIFRALARREALLLFDNCEHLIPAVADLVGRLLRSTRRISVLATSRSPLRVSSEAQWIVPGLGLPPGAGMPIEELTLSDAVRLFVERASAVDSEFRLTPENGNDVVEICLRLDGLPLAIEMATAWLRVLSPAQILGMLSDRLALLTRAARGATPRHETLKKALDWSYELLTPDLRSAFTRLSAFAGEFDLPAAQAVAGVGERTETLHALVALVEASMVTAVGGGTPEVHYRLLDTLREYGAGQLLAAGNDEAARDAHAGYFLGLLEQAEGTVSTPEFAAWITRLQTVYADLRLALDWSLARHPRSRTLRAAPLLFHLWQRTGDAREAAIWGERMLAGAEHVDAAQRGAAHLAVAFAGNLLGEPDRARAHAETAIRLYRDSADKRGLVTALFGGANVALQVGDVRSAAELSQEALAVCEEIGDLWLRAGPLATLSFVQLFGGGSLDETRRLAEEASTLYRELGDVAGQVIMSPLTTIAIRQGDVNGAEQIGLDIAAIAVGTAWEGPAFIQLAEARLARRDLEGAHAAVQRGLVRSLDAGIEIWFRIAVRDLALIVALDGEAERAAKLLGASRRNAHQLGLDPAIYEAVEAECRRSISADVFERATEEGYAMTHEELLDLADPL